MKYHLSLSVLHKLGDNLLQMLYILKDNWPKNENSPQEVIGWMEWIFPGMNISPSPALLEGD